MEMIKEKKLPKETFGETVAMDISCPVLMILILAGWVYSCNQVIHFSSLALERYSITPIALRGFELLMLQIMMVFSIIFLIVKIISLSLSFIMLKSAEDKKYMPEINGHWKQWLHFILTFVLMYYLSYQVKINIGQFFLASSNWYFLILIAITGIGFGFRLYKIIKPMDEVSASNNSDFCEKMKMA